MKTCPNTPSSDPTGIAAHHRHPGKLIKPKKEENTMKAITLTALFIAAMATANISSAATTHEPSVKTAHTGTQLNNDDQDEELRDTGELYPGLGLFKVRWP